MTLHITAHRQGFVAGYTRITAIDEAEHNTGIELGVLRLTAGESHCESVEIESAWLLMTGSVRLTVGEIRTVMTGHAARFTGKQLHAAFFST